VLTFYIFDPTISFFLSSVHYPLPLTYTGGPDPLIMQANIKKLQNEITFYRNSNQEITERLKELEAEKASARIMGIGSAHGGGHTTFSSQEPLGMQIQSLLDLIKTLEQKSVTERMGHLKEMEILLNENNYLREQVRGEIFKGSESQAAFVYVPLSPVKGL